MNHSNNTNNPSPLLDTNELKKLRRKIIQLEGTNRVLYQQLGQMERDNHHYQAVIADQARANHQLYQDNELLHRQNQQLHAQNQQLYTQNAIRHAETSTLKRAVAKLSAGPNSVSLLPNSPHTDVLPSFGDGSALASPSNPHPYGVIGDLPKSLEGPSPLARNTSG